MQAEFGAALPYTGTMLGFAAGGVAIGRAADRFGIARTEAVTGVALASCTQDLLAYALVHGALIGAFGAGALFGPVMAGASFWFRRRRRRGLAVPVAAAGSYVAGAVWPPIVAAATQACGWRATELGISMAMLLTIVPLASLLRARPPTQAEAGPTGPALATSRARLGLRPGLLMALLTIAGLGCCAAMATQQVHIVTYCGDLGYGPARGAEMDYRRDSANQNVVASVHIEALWDADASVGETRWLETLDKAHNIAARCIARAPLGMPEAEAVLEQQASFGRVVGVRDILSWHPDPAKRFAARPDLAEDPAWRRDLALLPKYNLIFELMMYPYQAGMVADLAREFPGMQLIVNHCGSPIDRDEEGMRRWRDGLRLISKHPNVALKISNMAAYDKQWTQASLRDVALHCIDCFGPDRTMLATDYPVARLQMTFDAIYDNLKQIVAGFSEHEQRALFHDNAAKFYRLDTLSSVQQGAHTEQPSQLRM